MLNNAGVEEEGASTCCRVYSCVMSSFGNQLTQIHSPNYHANLSGCHVNTVVGMWLSDTKWSASTGPPTTRSGVDRSKTEGTCLIYIC